MFRPGLVFSDGSVISRLMFSCFLFIFYFLNFDFAFFYSFTSGTTCQPTPPQSSMHAHFNRQLKATFVLCNEFFFSCVCSYVHCIFLGHFFWSFKQIRLGGCICLLCISFLFFLNKCIYMHRITSENLVCFV